MKSVKKPSRASSTVEPEARKYSMQPGYRLSQLELFNWGTFDGAVYSIEPDGHATLLVGENGSGKSTVIDALLTLLVRPQTRNYNVAAGAGKQERDERTYCRGAYDSTISAEGKSQVQYLRPSTGTYTALLAVFSKGSAHAPLQTTTEENAFTVAQILYMNADNSCQRIYATSLGRRTISKDLNGLQSGASMAKQLKERGFEIHASYQQYFQWLQRRTGLRSKAMDIFNQTVAVKDVQRLDSFIRQHMLEKHSWSDRLAKLLTHFHELSEAHRHLLRARQQVELLAPIALAGAGYQQQLHDVTTARDRLEALPCAIAESTVALLSPMCDEWEKTIEMSRENAERIDRTLEQKRREIARLEVQLEGNAPPSHAYTQSRIEQLDRWIEAYESNSRRRKDLLQRLGLLNHRSSEADPEQLRENLAERKSSITLNRHALLSQRDDTNRSISTLQHQLRNYRDSVEFLKTSQSKLPESLISVRDALCKKLRIRNSELPFVAELIAISPDQQAWADSIEHVLHGFARSLLVPEAHYERVTKYIEQNRLVDSKGQGQRMVYLRIPPTSSPSVTKTSTTKPNVSRLPEKLLFREHPLTPWLQTEISQRFNVKACDSIEDFQKTPPPAMTINRHFKVGPHRHEKSDRSTHGGSHGSHLGSHVLGWNTSDQIEMLLQCIAEGETKIAHLTREVDRLSAEEERFVGEMVAIDQLLMIEPNDSIQLAEHKQELESLQQSIAPSESESNASPKLQSRIAGLRAEVKQLQEDRDEHLGTRTQVLMESKNGRVILERARKQLESLRSSNQVLQQEKLRGEIQREIGGQWTLENLHAHSAEWDNTYRKRYDRSVEKMQPLIKEVTAGMARYLRAFPEASVDLDPDIASLPSFEALHEKLKADDLPRFESRFKDRLNEKVLHEVGLFHSSLENDRQEIREKIEQLNQALRLLEWKPGTHMRLEVNDVSDREIQEFRRELTSCLDRTLDASPETNEESFVRIAKLIAKLRDPAAERWRDKVVDVRNWFRFAAREIVTETGESRSYYEGGSGQSGGEKGKLAFLVLVAAIAYQYDLDPQQEDNSRFQFVMVDEMFSRSDDAHAEYALDLFHRFGLQLLIVAPLDAKVRVTEPYVGTYVQVLKDKQTNRSSLITITAEQIENR